MLAAPYSNSLTAQRFGLLSNALGRSLAIVCFSVSRSCWPSARRPLSAPPD